MPDRRIKRTKNNIYHALSALLLDKDIRSITVKELCERADVNKSTFYLHFLDIYDCKEKWQNEKFDEILSNVDNFSLDEIVHDPDAYIAAVVDYFSENLSFYKKLAASPLAAEFTYNLKLRLQEKIVESNGLDLKNNQMEITLVSFIMGGLLDSCLINLTNFDTDHISSILKSISNCISLYISNIQH